MDALIAPCVIKGSIDGEAFVAYIEKVLVPEPLVILHNLATHKNAATAKAM